MQWNKKTVAVLAILSFLLGSIGAIGFQAHAQQSNVSTSVQTPSSFEIGGEQKGTAINNDNTDNEKDNGGLEATTEQEKTEEVKDEIKENENLPDGGHQDQEGVNIDHQFEGRE